jgi:GNAT superfamily N-acetyltransferase
MCTYASCSTCTCCIHACCPCWLLQANGAIVEVEPLCVLDFYVHESCQRQGVGKALFEVGSTASSTVHKAHCCSCCCCCLGSMSKG